MPHLHELLASRVEDSRRKALEDRPRVGYFSIFEDKPKIVFTTRGRVTGLPPGVPTHPDRQVADVGIPFLIDPRADGWIAAAVDSG